MRVFGYFKSTSDQFGLNRGQFRGRDDDIGIHCEHRLDVAINREPTDDTPETVLIENIDQRRKVANAAVAYRFLKTSVAVSHSGFAGRSSCPRSDKAS